MKSMSNYEEALLAWNEYQKWIAAWNSYPPVQAKNEFMKDMLSGFVPSCDLCSRIGQWDYWGPEFRWLEQAVSKLPPEEQQFITSQLDRNSDSITIRGMKWLIVRQWRFYVSVLDDWNWIPCDDASVWENVAWRECVPKDSFWKVPSDLEWPAKLMKILDKYEDDDIVVVVDYHY